MRFQYEKYDESTIPAHLTKGLKCWDGTILTAEDPSIDDLGFLGVSLSDDHRPEWILVPCVRCGEHILGTLSLGQDHIEHRLKLGTGATCLRCKLSEEKEKLWAERVGKSDTSSD